MTSNTWKRGIWLSWMWLIQNTDASCLLHQTASMSQAVSVNTTNLTDSCGQNFMFFLCPSQETKHYVSKLQEGNRYCYLCIVYFCVWMKFCLFEILELDCKSCNTECHNLICFNLIHNALCGQEQTFPGLIAVWMWAHCVSRWHMVGLLLLIWEWDNNQEDILPFN